MTNRKAGIRRAGARRAKRTWPRHLRSPTSPATWTSSASRASRSRVGAAAHRAAGRAEAPRELEPRTFQDDDDRGRHELDQRSAAARPSVKIVAGASQVTEQVERSRIVARDHVRHARFPLQRHRAPPAGARRPARAVAAPPSARHTITLTCPDSSSSVTKVTPLAVCGRWRVMTSPATRTCSPCGVAWSIRAQH